MKALVVLFFALAVLVAGCGELRTKEARDAWADVGLNTALLAVDTLRAFGVDPAGADDTAVRYANAACRLIEGGAPVVVVAVNQRIAEANLERPLEEQVEPVDLGEIQALFHDVCIVVRALLEPAAPDPVPAPAPAPEPAAARVTPAPDRSPVPTPRPLRMS